MELAQEAGLQPKWAASTEGGEYKSSCPLCGGKDRFSIQPNKQMKNCLGRYYCRQCDSCGDAIKFAREFLGLSFPDALSRTNASLPSNDNPFAFITKEEKIFSPAPIITPKNQWTKKASGFTEWAHQNIWHQPTVLKWLQSRGLPEKAIHTYKIGWCPQDIWRNKEDWGLAQPGEIDKKIWLSQGIVIPTLKKNGDVMRLKIRRTNWKKGDNVGKYIAISGSMNGLNIIGDTRNEIIVVVESELDAYAIHYAIGDIVFVVAVGNNIKNPDAATDYHATKKTNLLICHDNDDAGKKMLTKWQRIYPHARGYPTPQGKDIGEAIEMGLDVRKWLLMHGWYSSSDKELIEWIINYIDQRTITRSAYTRLEKEIALGHNLARAKTEKLQNELRLMKRLIENHKK